jgi:hypothetical protein
MNTLPGSRAKLLVAFGAVLLLILAASSIYLWRTSETTERHALNHPQIALTPETDQAPTASSRESVGEIREAPRQREGVDAANLYKDAFVLWEKLTDEEKEILRPPLHDVSGNAAAALFQKIQPIMALLHEGAKADYCDWGFGELKFDTPMPHIGKAQLLGRLALWNAAYRVDSDPDGAIHDVAATFHLGHHLSETFFGLLVQVAMEGEAVTFVQRHVSALSPSASQLAREVLSTSFVEQDISRALRGEAAILASYVKLSPEARFNMVSAGRVRRNAYIPSEEIRDELLIGDSTRLAAEAEYTAGTYLGFANAMLLPRAQFDAWWHEIKAELPAHPVAQLTLAKYAEEARNSADANRVRRTMLMAGLAILQQGPEQLIQYRDPHTSGVFTYTPGDNGFALSSTFLHRREPLRMDFAAPRAR